jgi:hypothetical protein
MFIERGSQETLAFHLLRNADALNLSNDQRSRLLHAHRLSLGNAYQRDEGGAIAVGVREELAADIAATVSRAKDRKEAVSRFNAEGAVRIKGRDGLALAMAAGKITGEAWLFGLTYRAMYETAGHGIASALGAVDEGRGSGNVDRFVMAGYSRAMAGVDLTDVDGSVLAAHGAKALTILRQVAGQGVTLSALGDSGNLRATNVRRLVEALATGKAELAKPRNERRSALANRAG